MAEADGFEIRHFIEAALLASPSPLSIEQLQRAASARPGNPETSKAEIREALDALREDYQGRGIELIEVASGYRIQVRAEMGRELSVLFDERPPRYSRAFFETLALIAYRQPITRGEIEDVRGVSVSSNIIRSMMEREWIRIVGHRDVPGKPAMFGTTRAFLDYFNLKSLDDLPSLAELTDIESLRIQLDLPTVGDGTGEEKAEGESAPGPAVGTEDGGETVAGESGSDADEAGEADEAAAPGDEASEDAEAVPKARQEHG